MILQYKIEMLTLQSQEMSLKEAHVTNAMALSGIVNQRARCFFNPQGFRPCLGYRRISAACSSRVVNLAPPDMSFFQTAGLLDDRQNMMRANIIFSRKDGGCKNLTGRSSQDRAGKK